MIKTSKTKLDEIAQHLIEHINSSNTNSSPSLYVGDSGTALFFAYYNRYKQSSQSELAFDTAFDKTLEGIGEGVYLPTYCGGASGALYAIEFLRTKGFVDIDMQEAAESMNTYLEECMLKYISTGNYDFMHGAVGIALYFLKYGGEKELQACIKLIDELERLAIKDGDTMKWESKDRDNNKLFNISMSHGISSIAVFLTRAIKSGIDTPRCQEMLRLTIYYILKQQYDHHSVGSFFPSTSLEPSEEYYRKSRMAWCYGDLGVASAVWQAGCVLGNREWQEKALEVFEFAATRRNLATEMVVDAGICHGTAGIAQIFMRMHIESGNEKFAQANEYWIEETLKIAKWGNETAGYKKLGGFPEERKWESDYYFLEGITGIALAMLSYINSHDKSFSDWDEILLIS